MHGAVYSRPDRSRAWVLEEGSAVRTHRAKSSLRLGRAVPSTLAEPDRAREASRPKDLTGYQDKDADRAMAGAVPARGVRQAWQEHRCRGAA